MFGLAVVAALVLRLHFGSVVGSHCRNVDCGSHGRCRLFVCARATLDRWIRLGEKTPVAREFVGNAQVEAKLRACAQASSHGLTA